MNLKISSYYFCKIAVSNYKFYQMSLLSIILPAATFINRGEVIFAFLALCLQISIVGWVVAIAWAYTAKKNKKYNRRVSQYNY